MYLVYVLEAAITNAQRASFPEPSVNTYSTGIAEFTKITTDVSKPKLDVTFVMGNPVEASVAVGALNCTEDSVVPGSAST